MYTNILVTHKHQDLGIGCINRVLKKHVVVNWGLYGASKHLPTALNIVDVSGCKTITLAQYKAISPDNLPNNESTVIVGNEVKQYVGIGWITLRVVTHDDLKKYPRVI